MFKIEFETDNDAFQPNKRMEICAILRELIVRIDQERESQTIYDSNGNSIGHLQMPD